MREPPSDNLRGSGVRLIETKGGCASEWTLMARPIRENFCYGVTSVSPLQQGIDEYAFVVAETMELSVQGASHVQTQQCLS